MRVIVIGLVVSGLGVGGYAGYRSLGKSSPTSAYRTGTVERGVIVSTVMATGTVEPVLRVLVGSQVSGTVIQWYADFNQTVRKGEVLAELDQDQIKATIAQRTAAKAVAESRVKEEQARLTKAELDLARLERAYAADGASDFEVADARAITEGARAAHEAAVAQVRVAEAELQAAHIQFDKTIIRSPIDGIVISRNIDAGQTVAASLSAPTLFTIANDLRRMRVNAAVSETDIGRICEGMVVTFRVDAYPRRRFGGVVSQVRFAETVVANVVTYETLIETENPDLLLRPGMTATILFEIERAEDVVKVPNAALRFDPQRRPQDPASRRPGRGQARKPRVYKHEGGVLVEVTVELGINDGSFTQVLNGDVDGGDTVVVGWDLSARPRGRRPTGMF